MTQSAQLSISLDVECPHCEEYFDLLSNSLSYNDEGYMSNQACPSNKPWDVAHREFDEVVCCPRCGKSFGVEGIDY